MAKFKLSAECFCFSSLVVCIDLERKKGEIVFLVLVNPTLEQNLIKFCKNYEEPSVETAISFIKNLPKELGEIFFLFFTIFLFFFYIFFHIF